MLISYDDFKKVDLRVAKIVDASLVEGSDKLLRLQVSLGENISRQIIAGIGKVYNPEELLNKEIIVVANLEPRTLMGLESQGMLLAASDERGPSLLMLEREVLPGAEIR